MPTITIRDLDDKIVNGLKARAKANHRSLEAELREILTGLARERKERRQFLARAGRIAAMTPDRPQSDSARLLRQDRRR